MNKIYSICIALFMTCMYSINTNAATIIINVEDFEFNPQVFTINVGDNIIWQWDNSAGAHTTTSTVIPTGAVSWDHVINQNSQSFSYTATVAGNYDYICSYHVSMGMQGHFTVNGTTGIAPLQVEPMFSIDGKLTTATELTINYSIPEMTKADVKLYDVLGKCARTLLSSSKIAGLYTETFSIADLKKGIYILSLQTGFARTSCRIQIQ